MESHGRVVYSHKTHEKCADIFLTNLARIRLLQMVLSAITTAGFISAVFGAGQVTTVVGWLDRINLSFGFECIHQEL